MLQLLECVCTWCGVSYRAEKDTGLCNYCWTVARLGPAKAVFIHAEYMNSLWKRLQRWEAQGETAWKKRKRDT